MREATRSIPWRDPDLDHARKAVQDTRSGDVRVIIRDGVIVHVERVEKQRVR
jgi:hypothetical protein